MDDVDLHAWFKSDELESCAACGEHGAIRLPTNGSTLCLSCGAVHAAAGAARRRHRTIRRLTLPLACSSLLGRIRSSYRHSQDASRNGRIGGWRPRSNAASSRRRIRMRTTWKSSGTACGFTERVTSSAGRSRVAMCSSPNG